MCKNMKSVLYDSFLHANKKVINYEYYTACTLLTKINECNTLKNGDRFSLVTVMNKYSCLFSTWINILRKALKSSYEVWQKRNEIIHIQSILKNLRKRNDRFFKAMPPWVNAPFHPHLPISEALGKSLSQLSRHGGLYLFQWCEVCSLETVFNLVKSQKSHEPRSGE